MQTISYHTLNKPLPCPQLPAAKATCRHWPSTIHAGNYSLRWQHWSAYWPTYLLSCPDENKASAGSLLSLCSTHWWVYFTDDSHGAHSMFSEKGKEAVCVLMPAGDTSFLRSWLKQCRCTRVVTSEFHSPVFAAQQKEGTCMLCWP